MKPERELGISNQPHASFKAFRLHQPAFRSHWHYHPELELVFFSKGKGIRFIGDDISMYQEGELFLIGENLPHTFVTYEDESASFVEALCIQFPAQLFDSFTECRPLTALFQEANRGLAFAQPADELIACLKRAVFSTGVNALMALMTVLAELTNATERVPILTEVYQRHAALSDAPTRIRTAIDFINANYQRPILVPEIAQACHFSPNAFCRWFKQQMGLTFVDYLNKVRLTHVCQLLVSTDFPVGQIALRTGFDNISTLNRLFQQKLHTSPSRYRNKVMSGKC
ncbi:AraC family transcriptional regulator [Fibrella aquatilis]|uniref:Helix-turn-helix domain-containing protein n=1 Tax=Fibrella aquatilis TaxID=2817059 RepID=A0A939G7T2_9BACT|nr:AraC family transcriptional regulator [Fibrella aquatilis]MBO0931626.1 helix-turn-helix domain-containing protein [Fibrella aquatilis]